MKKNGFTLIEILAVVIILGILMFIAVPAVSKYILGSRNTAYVDTVYKYVDIMVDDITNMEYSVSNPDYTYYIPTKCLATESGNNDSPYGEFLSSYVVVTYNAETKKNEYYYTGVDDTGHGILLTYRDLIDEDSIKNDLSSNDITTTIGIGDRQNIYVFSDSCDKSKRRENISVRIEDKGTIDSDKGGSTVVLTTDMITKGQTTNQFNQIPGTDIYIYKGSNPANYVRFNDEIWRIIGIYGNQMKIIRVDGTTGQPTAPTTPVNLTSINWSLSMPNPGWVNSSLKDTLNTSYYNSLNQTTKDMIDENGSWNVGPAALNATASQAYASATTSGTVVGDVTHTTPWIGKVGLMATYEFLYASAGSGCQSIAGNNGNFNTCGAKANDWLQNSSVVLWTLTSKIDNPRNSLNVYNDGFVHNYSMWSADDAVPVVYLKSSVKIIGGNGESPSTAYILK